MYDNNKNMIGYDNRSQEGIVDNYLGAPNASGMRSIVNFRL